MLPAVEVDEHRAISIITKDTGNENAPCKATVTTPEGRTDFLPTKKVPGGYEAMFHPLKKGPHKIRVEIDNKEVPKSPIDVVVEDKLDIKKLQVKGLEKRKSLEPACCVCVINMIVMYVITCSFSVGFVLLF